MLLLFEFTTSTLTSISYCMCWYPSIPWDHSTPGFSIARLLLER